LSKQVTAGNPFQEGQKEDQRHPERMISENIQRSQKCQIGRLLSNIEEDGRNWLGRPKLCIKSCTAIIIIIIKGPSENSVNTSWKTQCVSTK